MELRVRSSGSTDAALAEGSGAEARGGGEETTAGSSTCEASAKAAPLELLMTARIQPVGAAMEAPPQSLRTLHATLHETLHATWPCCSSGASFCTSLAATVSSKGFLRWPAQQVGERWVGGSWCAGRCAHVMLWRRAALPLGFAALAA